MLFDSCKLLVISANDNVEYNILGHQLANVEIKPRSEFHTNL